MMEIHEYYNSIVRRGERNGPTCDEAKRDLERGYATRFWA